MRTFASFTLLFIMLLINSIYAEGQVRLKTILLPPFAAYKSSREAELEIKIQKFLKQELEKEGYTVTSTDSPGFSQNLRKAKEEQFELLIEGYYQRSPDSSNVSIFSQIYLVKDGFIIDACNILDYMILTEGVKLDKEEIKEEDKLRIQKYTKKLIQQLKANPSRKENRGNLEENLLSTRLIEEYKLPLNNQQQSIEKERDAVFDLIQSQVTVSATKISKRTNEAPNLVSVFRPEEIEEYGKLSLNEILYQLPGFAPSMDYDRRTVSSRGMFEGWNNNHLLLLMDGVQFNDSLYGSAYTWEITPMNFIKSLEVIRGPGSALYGSNATNGVVSINTYTGEDLKGEVKFRLRGGDYGTRINELLTGNSTQYVSYVASFSQYKTEGNNYKSEDGSYRLDDFGYYKKFDVKDKRSNSYAFLRLDGNNSFENFGFQYHRQDWSFETGHGWLWRIPDLKENMHESMETFSLSYKDKQKKKLNQEYIVRLQNRTIDWFMRYGENNAYEEYYPSGIWENLETGAYEVLTRAQWTYLLENGGSFLLGLEGSFFRYSGDKNHYSNIALADAANGWPPYDNGEIRKQGPWLEWIKDQGIPKGAIFAQLVSGKLFHEFVEITLGIRYDHKVAKFKGIDEPYAEFLSFPYKPEEKRVFSKTSPRLGLVFFPMKNLTIKAMGGSAFREPSITELFGANTFTLASNPRQLKAEVIHTRELGLDWFVQKNTNFRLNFFDTRFENQIAYSIANNNLSSNIYTLHTQGVESEVLLHFKELSGYINYSYNKRIGELIQDNTVSKSDNSVTWSPVYTGNAGVLWKILNFHTGFSLHYQGKVYRRNSDLGQIEPLTGILLNDPNMYPVYRPRTVPSWIDASLRFSYDITKNLQAGIYFSNLFNTSQKLIKNNNYPFDYLREGRRFLIELKGSF